MPIQGYPTATHYAPAFSRRELDCRCGCPTPQGVQHNLAALAEHLQALRALAGGPLTVHSGYRCPGHNEAVGGAEFSQHVQGLAADVSSRAVTPAKLAQLAGKVPTFAAGGIGTYKTWVHVDIRRNGPARWKA
jgi:uncharacterized protein YcbK (DUF882 family)